MHLRIFSCDETMLRLTVDDPTVTGLGNLWDGSAGDSSKLSRGRARRRGRGRGRCLSRLSNRKGGDSRRRNVSGIVPWKTISDEHGLNLLRTLSRENRQLVVREDRLKSERDISSMDQDSAQDINAILEINDLANSIRIGEFVLVVMNPDDHTESGTSHVTVVSKVNNTQGCKTTKHT